MTRLLALAALLALSACAKPPTLDAEPVMEAETAAKVAAPADCAPGEGDGIGGTGCKID